MVALGPQPKELVPLGAPDPAALAKALASLPSTDGKSSPTFGLEAAFANLPNDDARARHVAVLTNGVLPPGADANAVGAFVVAKAKAGTLTSALGVGHTPYNDPNLEQLARAGRGHYAFIDTPDEAARALEHLRRPIVATAPRLTVTFDPAAVSLYRLIGFESRAAGRSDGGGTSEPAVLRGGEATTVLFELKLADAPKAKWGDVQLDYIAPDTKAGTLTVPIKGLKADRPIDRAGPDTILAVVAAGAAEKLRGSYWARTLSWTQLSQLLTNVPAAALTRPDVASLGELVKKVGALDKRGDKYESMSPQARMDFDRLPVLQ